MCGVWRALPRCWESMPCRHERTRSVGTSPVKNNGVQTCHLDHQQIPASPVLPSRPKNFWQPDGMRRLWNSWTQNAFCVLNFLLFCFEQNCFRDWLKRPLEKIRKLNIWIFAVGLLHKVYWICCSWGRAQGSKLPNGCASGRVQRVEMT